MCNVPRLTATRRGNHIDERARATQQIAMRRSVMARLVPRFSAIVLTALVFGAPARAQFFDLRSLFNPPGTSDPAAGKPAAPEWSGEAGASGHPLMTAEAIRAAAGSASCSDRARTAFDSIVPIRLSPRTAARRVSASGCERRRWRVPSEYRDTSRRRNERSPSCIRAAHRSGSSGGVSCGNSRFHPIKSNGSGLRLFF